MNLKMGLVTVMFEADQSASAQQLWKAVKDGGFTPVRVETAGQVYEGPQSGAIRKEGTR
ncbi:MAG: hypothetical protein IID40_10680 [Planctomycetes bacterium]|nr:hypothetical protein [Planctomycetota bacterium]